MFTKKNNNRDIKITGDEQSDKARQWWSENSTSIIAGVVIGIVGIVGYNYWQSQGEIKAVEAAGEFSKVKVAFEGNDLETVTKHADILKDDFSSSDYAAQANILLGIAQLKAEQPENAVKTLQWTLDNVDNIVTANLARLNLAKAFVDTNDYDAALSTLEVDNVGGYKNQYDELKADVYSLKGENDKAAELYQSLLDNLPQHEQYRNVIEAKMNAL